MDTVQRQLSLLDRQLAEGDEFYRQSFAKSPLLVCAASLIAAILVQDVLGVGIRLWLVLLAICVSAAVVLFAIAKEQKPVGVLAILACVCFACLGAVRFISYRQLKANDISNFVGEEQRLATVRGVVISEPYVDDRSQWAYGRFVSVDPSSSFYLKLDAVRTPAGWAKASGAVRMQVQEPLFDISLGDYIQAYCVLSRFQGPANWGQFNVAEYLAQRNVFVAATVKSREGLEMLNRDSVGVFLPLQRKLKEIARVALLGTPTPQTESQGLLAALLLGSRRHIGSEMLNAFRETGLLHFISLSGLHVGILVWIIWWICRRLGLAKSWRALICMVWLGLFVLIVPPRAPILRAAIICWVFCASVIVQRRPNALNTLSLAAIILLLLRPTEIFNAGWQLSFATVLGILFFTSRIENFLHERTDNWFWDQTQERDLLVIRFIKWLGITVVKLLSVGFGAWLGGAGILLYHFHTVTPLSSIWTVVVFPLVGAALLVGFLKIIISLLVPGVAAVFGVIVGGLSDFLIWLVKVIASLDISEIVIGSVPGGLILGYYGLVAFAGFAYFRRPVIKKGICIAAGLVLIIFIGSIKWRRTHRDYMEVTCLSVGQGQAILAALPGGANILFDAGSLSINNCGRRIVVPFLNFRGTKKVDAILMSHGDIDHVNGVPEIVEDCRVRAVYANGAFIDAAGQRGTEGFLNKMLKEKGLEVKSLSRGMEVTGLAKIQMLWPSEEFARDERLGDNDKSQVVLIEFAGRRIVLCSDIQQFAQQKLVELYPELRADVVVAPHHGSARSLWAGFLEAIEPGMLVFSCGRTQYERQIFNVDEQVESYYTARDGAIKVRVEGNGTIKVDTCENSG